MQVKQKRHLSYNVAVVPAIVELGKGVALTIRRTVVLYTQGPL